MKRGVAIAIGASALFHVSVALVLGGIEPPEKKRPKPALRLGMAPIQVQAQVPDAVPIDVTMVVVTPPEVAPPEISAAPTAPTSRRLSAPAAAATAAGSESETAGEPAAAGGSEPGVDGDPSRPGMLSMRGRGRPDLGLARRGASYLDVPYNPEARSWTPPEASGELAPDGSGKHKTQRPGYRGHVDDDGKVSFEDGKAFSAEWRVPNPKKVAKRVARGFENWFRDPHEAVRRQQVDKSTCHKGGGDGTNNCLVAGDYTRGSEQVPGADLAKNAETDGEADDAVVIPIVGGGAELTDYVMRKVGQDPYQADKLRWMDATREERGEIKRVHDQRQLKKVDQQVRRHLDHLWARTDLDLAAKRAALFELWDDTAEDGDKMVVEAAERARKQIIGFVRARLPAGKPGAFTDAELDALNRRRTSRARFAPY